MKGMSNLALMVVFLALGFSLNAQYVKPKRQEALKKNEVKTFKFETKKVERKQSNPVMPNKKEEKSSEPAKKD
jgi:hypothetical protein